MPVERREEEREKMARSNVVTLNLSERGLRKIEAFSDGLSAQTVLFNNNNIARIENLQCFEHLQQLSLANNHLVEMAGIAQAQGLKVLDLSNNSIITIEGLTHLRSLEWLNLSGNSIKRMQNLEKNINLCHLDLSDNSIVKISNLKNLTKLKTLLLHGNLISSLKNMTENVSTSSVVTLSLEENEILDLNEITNLKSLTSLEQLSIAGNPCLLALSNVIGFNYRPFILVNCAKLRNLDGHLISQSDRLDSEKLRSEGQLRAFSPGRHLQLVKYLTQATPVRKSKTPTPVLDSISSQADRWSVPVLEDKPSTQADDLAVEDISQAEYIDDQLVSESCYVPISDASMMSSFHGDTDNIEDWLVVDKPNQNGIEKELLYSDVIPNKTASIGLPVEGSPGDEKPSTSNRQSDIEEASSLDQEEKDADQPVMTEEEAFDLINLAATIIQSRVRGFLVRKKLNFYQYHHKKQAAILIQALWRGYRTRTYDVKVITARNEIRTRRLTAHVNHLAGLVIQCQEQTSRDKRTMAKAIKCLWGELEKQNTRYVAWLHSQQSRAAVTIQKYWRGYQARKSCPRPKRAAVTPYEGLASMCRDMYEQIELLKKQVDELKSDKVSKKDDANEQTPDEPYNPGFIPAIRVIRPSVCILPELELDESTKEHLKKQGDLESALDDVDIEPLDIGEYDKDEQDDVGNTTFDVETSAFGMDGEDNVDEDIAEQPAQNQQSQQPAVETTSPKKQNSSSFESHSQNTATSGSNLDADVDEELESESTSDEAGEFAFLVRANEKDEDEEQDTVKREEDTFSDSDVKNGEVLEEKRVCDFENGAIEGKEFDSNVKSDYVGKTKKKYDVVENKAIGEKEFDDVKINASNEQLVGDLTRYNLQQVDKDNYVEELEEKKSHKLAGHKQNNEDFKDKTTPACDGPDTETTSSFDIKNEDNPSKDKEESFDLETSQADDHSNSSKQDDTDVSGTTSPSIQADVSLSDVSQTSDSSSSTSPTKSDSGKKKKKLLLRTTSADQVSRLRALHFSSSLDSERMSSSLNFDTRLSQRSASLLKELRNEIASLTVRYQPKDDENNTGKTSEDSSKIDDELNDIHPASDSIESPDIPRDGAGTRQVGPDIPHNGPEATQDKLLDGLNSVGSSGRTDQNIISQPDIPRGRPGIPRDGPEASRDLQSLPEGRTVEGIENENETEDKSRKQSFTMPVFDDVEASLSMEDFLEDSLDERD